MRIQRRVLLALGVTVALVPMLLWQGPVSGTSAPVNPEVVYVANSSTPEIGLSNAYGSSTTTIDVAAAGGVASPSWRQTGPRSPSSRTANSTQLVSTVPI